MKINKITCSNSNLYFVY